MRNNVPLLACALLLFGCQGSEKIPPNQTNETSNLGGVLTANYNSLKETPKHGSTGTGQDQKAEIINSSAELIPGSRNHNYFSSNQIHRKLVKLAFDHDRKIWILCHSRYVIGLKSLVFIEAANFPNDSTHPQSGMWSYRYEVARYGESKIYNAAVSGQLNSPPLLILTAPGTSGADFQLQKDLMPHIMGMAAAILKNRSIQCKALSVSDSRISVPLHNAKDQTGVSMSRVWSEEWTIYGCGEKTLLTIRFIENKNRGGFDFVVSPFNR